MLLQQLRLIGKYVVGSRDPLSTVLNQQGEYKSPFLLMITVNLKTNSFEIGYEEYDETKERRYLRGTTSGNKTSYSPSMNFQISELVKGLNEKKKQIGSNGNDPFFSLLFSGTPLTYSQLESYLSQEKGRWLLELLQKTLKFDKKILKITTKSTFSQFSPTSPVVLLFDFISKNIDSLLVETFLFLRNNIMQYDEKKQSFSINKKQTASTLLFKIVEESSTKYLGDYPEFQDLYLCLVEEEKPKQGSSEMTCYTCGDSILTPNYPNVGFFTIDQVGFSLGFEKKGKASFLVVCDECDQDIKKGFEVVSTDLRFWAYKTPKGVYGSEGQYVYHYVIPLISSPNGLKEAVKQIRRIKKDFGTKRKESLQERINNLETMLQKAERKRKQSIKKEIKELKKKLKQSEEELGERTDLLQLLMGLSVDPLNFLDLYYYVSDAKQNPSTKEIVGFYVVDKSRIVFLRDLLAKRSSNFNFRDLIYVLGEKLFRRALASLFEGKPLLEDAFFKQFTISLQKSFKEKLYNIERGGSDYYLPFERTISLFKESYELFLELGSFNPIDNEILSNSLVDVSVR